MDKKKKECRCFIRHASTSKERKGVVDRLTYSRSIGDSLGTMLAIAMLGACPSKVAK